MWYVDEKLITAITNFIFVGLKFQVGHERFLSILANKNVNSILIHVSKLCWKMEI